jgi:hypothetical protein
MTTVTHLPCPFDPNDKPRYDNGEPCRYKLRTSPSQDEEGEKISFPPHLISKAKELLEEPHLDLEAATGLFRELWEVANGQPIKSTIGSSKSTYRLSPHTLPTPTLRGWGGGACGVGGGGGIKITFLIYDETNFAGRIRFSPVPNIQPRHLNLDTDDPVGSERRPGKF